MSDTQILVVLGPQQQKLCILIHKKAGWSQIYIFLCLWESPINFSQYEKHVKLYEYINYNMWQKVYATSSDCFHPFFRKYTPHFFMRPPNLRYSKVLVVFKPERSCEGCAGLLQKTSATSVPRQKQPQVPPLLCSPLSNQIFKKHYSVVVFFTIILFC